MTDKTFEIAGISTRNGSTKFRFTNNANYIKVLERDNHTKITLYALPEPMTRESATQFLLDKGHAEDRAVKANATKSTKAAAEPAEVNTDAQERAADDATLDALDGGELSYDDELDQFVEPKDEAIQVKMSKLAKQYPGLGAPALLEMATLDDPKETEADEDFEDSVYY